jgi:hypothetical protein
MTPQEWHDMLDDALDGILICTPEEETKAREKIHTLRRELPSAYLYRTEFEQKIEATIRADKMLEKAIDEYLEGQVGAVLASALHTQSKARRTLKERDENGA